MTSFFIAITPSSDNPVQETSQEHCGSDGHCDHVAADVRQFAGASAGLKALIRRPIMLVRVSASVEEVGEACEIADLQRSHRIGAIIGELMEMIEIAHPGEALLQHVVTIRSEPAKGDPIGPALIR
jgi:hypothetical protein